MKKSIVEQPDWVCDSCGHKYGIYFQPDIFDDNRKKSVSTYHKGECGVCHEMRVVTEPRDFGYLCKEWELASLIVKIQKV